MKRNECDFYADRKISTYDEYLLESFVDEYKRDECYEDFLHESREISYEKRPLEHDDSYREHSNPHADPQTKHQKLYLELVTHLQAQHTQCFNQISQLSIFFPPFHPLWDKL